MNDLFLSLAGSSGFLHGVYWCTHGVDSAEALSPLVKKLAEAIGTNFQLVPIAGFDDLFEKDLLASMSAAGARPTRRQSGYSAVGMPADMRPLDGFAVSGFERSLLLARLGQYAERTDMWRPSAIDNAWVEQMMDRLDLVRPIGDHKVPTLAGWLLFSGNPSEQFAQARVQFQATGPAHWLKARFGDDIDLDEAEQSGNYTVRRTITGNLWNQLDALTDLLALINFQFRLKAEISKTVNAYHPLAVKEMIVNAIVHRDYERNDPVEIRAEPNSITVISPGGLIAEIAAQVGGQPFQQVVTEHRGSIKGYRNPAISDLFYGGGQMDRAGSGLSDMVVLTVNNNGGVEFGPTDDNQQFAVTMLSRPEAVDEITNTALPLAEEVVRYSSNVVPIEALPETVWHCGTTAKSNRSFYNDARGLAVPPGHVVDGRFFSFYDLANLASALVTPFDEGDIETMGIGELLAMSGGDPILMKLLYNELFAHLRARGLQVEYDRRRAYFAKGDDLERKLSYQGRLRKATRTVVKARTKRDSDNVLYYEHKAVTFSVMRFGQDWGVILTPGYAFTRDGARKAISRERTNSLSTRRAARDFNPTVLQDVSFWVAVLAGETEGLFALEHEPSNDLARFAPTILLSHRTPTISFNVSAFEETSQLENEIDDDLRRLDDELEAMALEPEEQEPDEKEGADDEEAEDPEAEEPEPDTDDDH
jgi:hypothetical protein